eukprot:1161376-Pelagomonas_calceolata.AAC.10
MRACAYQESGLLPQGTTITTTTAAAATTTRGPARLALKCCCFAMARPVYYAKAWCCLQSLHSLQRQTRRLGLPILGCC